MNNTPPNSYDNKEIDLSQVSKKIGDFFESMATGLFKAILFFKRNVVVIGILFVLGVLLGFYLDKTSKIYDNQLIVSPNFGSNEYLYKKINLLNSKILDGDTLFLKNVVGIQHPKKFKKIEINPITDVYKFIDNKKDNFELLKLMAEDGDISTIIKDEVTSKNYPYHEIKYVTAEITSEAKTLEPLLNYLNNSAYYTEIKKEYINNIKIKIVENDSIIRQIDGVLNNFNNKIIAKQNDKLMYYNENTQLNEIIVTKNELVNEQGSNRIQLINLNKIIKDRSATLNVKKTNTINGKMKIIVPILFIIVFVLGGMFKSFYNNQLAKSKL